MGTAGSKSDEGKLKPDNISTVSMALETATKNGGNDSHPPTKPSRGNSSSVRQQQPAANGAAVGYPPPAATLSGAQMFTNKSTVNSGKTTTSSSVSVPLNGGNSITITKPAPSSRPRVMDFNGNHFYQPATKHSLGKASTTSSNYHRHYYTGDDTNNNNNSIYQHDNNNNSNTFKSSTSVKVDIDGEKAQQPLRTKNTVVRNNSSTSGGGGRRSESRLSQYSALTDSKSEVAEKEKKAKMAKTGRKSGSILVVFLLELISLVGLAVLAYFLRFTENFAVIKQDYSCGTFTLSKEGPPFKDSIVFSGLKATEYYLIFGLGPVLMIFLSEIARSIIIYSLSHDSSSNTVHQKALGIPFPLFIRRIVRIIAGFLFGLLLTTILVDVIKVQTGALRPYFGTFCKNLTEHCKSSPETLNATQVDDLCKGISSEDMREARLSFPSVSGALAAYSATFMILYLAFALPYRALRFIRLWITLGLVAIVFFTVNAGLSTFQHHSEDMIVGLIIGLLFALYAVFIHLNAFANRLSVSNPLSAKRAGEENVGNKKNIEGGPLSSSPFSDPFDETGSLSNRGSGSAGGLFGGGNSGGGGENDKDWFWKNFHIPRVRQSARNMWRRSENYFSGRGRGGNRNVTNTSPRTSGLHPTTTTATTNLSRHTSNAYINPAFNGGGSRLNDDHILANHLHQETRFGGNGGNGNGNGNGNGALGASNTANLHHPGANHRASSTLRTFQASSNA